MRDSCNRSRPFHSLIQRFLSMNHRISPLRAALLCTALTVAGMASAQAADFSCASWVGSTPLSPTMTNFFARISAPTQAQAEARYLAQASRVPIARRGLHNLRCTPL